MAYLFSSQRSMERWWECARVWVRAISQYTETTFIGTTRCSAHYLVSLLKSFLIPISLFNNTNWVFFLSHVLTIRRARSDEGFQQYDCGLLCGGASFKDATVRFSTVPGFGYCIFIHCIIITVISSFNFSSLVNLNRTALRIMCFRSDMLACIYTVFCMFYIHVITILV